MVQPPHHHPNHHWRPRQHPNHHRRRCHTCSRMRVPWTNGPRRDGCSCDSTADAGAIATAACGRRCCRCSTCSCTGTATGTTVALQRRCSTFAITCIAIARGESHHACKAGAGQLRQCRRFSGPCPNPNAGGYPCATIRKQECAQARMEQKGSASPACNYMRKTRPLDPLKELIVPPSGN